MKLGLGTVQFGMNYGVSNKNGKPSLAEVQTILHSASEAGIRLLDTASLYGTSEEVLGQALGADSQNFQIVTKTPSFQGARIGEAEITRLRTTFLSSLDKLRRQQLYGLLIHHADDLRAEGGGALFAEMRRLQKAGWVNKIGVSVYTAQQIDAVLELGEKIDLLQLPFNLLDQRLAESGHLRKLKGAGVEIHIRSVFLQGLLLLDPDQMPSHFSSVQNHLRQLRAQAQAQGLTMLEAALGYVLQLPEIDRVIVGVTKGAELQQILSAAKKIQNGSYDYPKIAQLARWQDERILNPSLWEKYA